MEHQESQSGEPLLGAVVASLVGDAPSHVLEEPFCEVGSLFGANTCLCNFPIL